MSGGWIPPPTSEQNQDAWWTYPWGPTPSMFPQVGTTRSAPAELPFKEYDPDLGGWWQGDHRLKNFKPKMYFTRPSDGKRTGTLGRLKDAVTGEGADVFVTTSGDKRSLMRDRPQRWQWTNGGMTLDKWYERFWDKDWRPQDDMLPSNTPWTSPNRDGQRYNFRSREYEAPRPWWFYNPNNDRVWMDAHWAEGAKHGSRNPLSKQLVSGQWLSRVPWDSGIQYPWDFRGRAGGRARGRT